MPRPDAPNSIWMDFLGADIRFVQGQRYRIRIAEAGQEHPETLLMLHGGGGHIETFSRNLVPLAQHFHVIGVEMLWHGMTDAPPMWDHMNAQVTDEVLDLLDTLGLDKVWIHGEAGGASGMTPLVLNHPDRLKGVIFESGIAIKWNEGSVKPPVAPPAGGISMVERSKQLLRNLTWDGVRARLLMVMHRDHPEQVTDELVDARLAHYLRPSTNDGMIRVYDYYASGKGAQYLATEEDVSKIDLPVLAIWNDGSEGAGPDAGERLASLIPGAQFKLLPQTGFWAHWEKPAEFNEAVRQFITGEKVT